MSDNNYDIYYKQLTDELAFEKAMLEKDNFLRFLLEDTDIYAKTKRCANDQQKAELKKLAEDLKETVYRKACTLMENKNYSRANRLFCKLEEFNYKDATQKRSEAEKKEAIQKSIRIMLIKQKKKAEMEKKYWEVNKQRLKKASIFDSELRHVAKDGIATWKQSYDDTMQFIEELEKAEKTGDYTKAFGGFDITNFGTYNGEKITWRVLDKKVSRVRGKKLVKLLMVSEKILDKRCYDDSDTNSNWEHCSLKYWVKNAFVKEAFTKQEWEKVSDITLLTSDQVNEYFENEADRLAFDSSNYCCEWWLRTLTEHSRYAHSINEMGNQVDKNLDESLGIRPAVWIKLNY